MCSVRSVEESVLKVFEAVCDECDDRVISMMIM